MIQPLKHHAVNWVDGMKISQKHFTAQEDHFADSLRDVGSFGTTSYNYGLLPIKDVQGGQRIFDILNSATNDIRLAIRQCHAITPAGLRIAISDLNINININSLDGGTAGAETQYYILISVDPFHRVPFGEFDPEETPPRHISTQPRYHVELVPVGSTSNEHSGGNYIVAGRVLLKNGIANADSGFIPPCTSLHSHPTLLEHYGNFAKNISGLQQYAIRIIQKNRFKNQDHVLAERIKELCKVMLEHFSDTYFYYRNVVHQLPPVHLVTVFAQLAHGLYNAIETFDPKEKEETLNYCYEWSEVAPHTLLNQLSSVVEIYYDHYNNAEYMARIALLLKSLGSIFEKLSNLEYIGQHKENIVVKEQAITQVVKEKKGWSVLD